MEPKDSANIDWNYFYSAEMKNGHEEVDEIDLTSIQRAPSNDSLEENIPNLRPIGGYHKWINTNDNTRVENFYVFNNNEDSIDENTFLINNKNQYEIEDEMNSSQTDSSLNHFDIQLQVDNGQLQQIIRYEVFSLPLEKDMNPSKLNQSSQTMEPEMDMDNGNGRRNGNYKGYSQQYNGNNNNNNNDGSNRRNYQTNGSSGNGGSADGNGSNPNRNNNNSRRPNDDDASEGNEDDDNETDEDIARLLGFRPIDNETIRTIGRLRRLTNTKSFDRRNLENVQYLIDELIRLQHLENSSQEQLEKIVHYFKLHRALRTKSQALTFIQERLPRRNPRTNSENNSNVFNIWRARERRARLDSTDSLEDDGLSSSTGQPFQDVSEINQPTSSAIPSNDSINRSKVKQMARHIDTRSGSLRAGRSASPSPTNLSRSFDNIHKETFGENRSRTKRNASPVSLAEQHRVRQMIDRLESSSTSASNTKITKRNSIRKTFQDDHSDGSASFASSSPDKRITRRENYENSITNPTNGSFIFRHKSPHEDIHYRNNNANLTRFELDREEIINRGRRNASGATTDDYITSLVPGSETSISMVRDVRARLYESEATVSRTDVDNIPVKVDVETLYILEQKSIQSINNNNVTDHEHKRLSAPERHDFAMQTTTIPISHIKATNRPIGTQVDSVVERNTVAAQTTDSLHHPVRERRRLPSSPDEDGEVSRVIRTTTTSKYEIKRRHSSHHTSEDEDEAGSTVIYIDDKDNFELKQPSVVDDQLEHVPEQRSSFGQVTSRLRIDQLRDINRNVVRRHVEQQEYDEHEHRSSEVYEIHTRGACKCLVVSYDEKTQYGPETRFEKQLKRIESTYTDAELKSTELHIIVASSDGDYQLVRRDYGSLYDTDDTHDHSSLPTIAIHYYTKEGHRMRTEQARRIEHLPLFIRCEIEYELNHYGSAQLILLSATNAERRQKNVSIKKEIVNETISRTSGRLAPNSPELENEIAHQIGELISLVHLADYSSRDDYSQKNSTTDVRRVSRTDLTTSLRIVQRYRTVIHRLCQLHRSHLHLTNEAEKQRHLILVARDEYYLFDLAFQTSGISGKKYYHDTTKREVTHQPFDYAKYRRDTEQQQRILEQHYRQTHNRPSSRGQQSEAEFYLGSGRRALIEREIHSMRESIRPHEHAPPRYKHEPARRSLSISYSGGQRYVRARIIHVKDYYDESQQQQQHQQQQQQQPQNAKEQELFVRVDDYINESVANSLRRSYSTDYLNEDGPRSRIRYIRIPGETIKIEEKTTYEYQGVMYTDLPYALRYWNILYILDREAREGRPLGSSLPHVVVNDPYQAMIPPLTQQEIRQTAQQVLSPQYRPRTYTDQTLRWFLSRDNRTEVESNKYLQTLSHCRQQQKQTGMSVRGGGQAGVGKKYYVTETLVRYEKMPDRLVPVPVPVPANDRAQSIDNIHHRSPSASRLAQQSFHSQTRLDRSRSQPRPQHQPSSSKQIPNLRAQLPTMHSPLSRHQSVNELHATSTLSHPPSPSPSLHSLHSNHNCPQTLHRRPVAFKNRFQPQAPSSPQPPPPPQHQQSQAQPTNPLFTEIIDSQTGRRIVTTGQEQLPTEVLGLLNRYKLQ